MSGRHMGQLLPPTLQCRALTLFEVTNEAIIERAAGLDVHEDALTSAAMRASYPMSAAKVRSPTYDPARGEQPCGERAF